MKIDRRNTDAPKPADADKELFITVFADASLCPDTKAWGIGIWYRDGANKPVEYSEGGRGRFMNSNDAELHGLNVAKRLIEENCDVRNRVIVFQCDNTSAINNFTYASLKMAGAKYVKMKHVKAHTSNKTNRTAVNAIVDRLAKARMNHYRGIDTSKLNW